jgi:MFS family permease
MATPGQPLSFGVTPRPTASTAALVLLIAFGCNVVGRGIGDSFMVFVLPLSAEFGWTRAAVSSVYSAFLVVTGLSAPITGMLIDRWGPRVVYPLGLMILGAACLLASRLSELWQFQLALGLVAGAGVSMLGMVPASMLIGRWFRDRMSTAMGVAYAGFGIGTLAVVPIAQRLIELFGWRQAYAALGLGALALLPLMLLLPWQRIAGDRPKAARAEAREPAGPALARALRTRAYWQIVQLFAFTSLTTFSVITQVVPFLVESGLSPIEAAAAFGTAGLLSVFGIMGAGWAADRVGYRRTVTVTFVSTFLGVASLYAFSHAPAPWLVVAFIACFGSCQGARGPVVSALAASHFGGPAFATIYGTMFAWMSVAGAIGTFVAGWLFDVTGGYRAGLAFSMACVLVAVAPFWGARPLARRPVPPPP